jgi:hypothetical protein
MVLVCACVGICFFYGGVGIAFSSQKCDYKLHKFEIDTFSLLSLWARSKDMVAEDWYRVYKGHFKASHAVLKLDGPDEDWSMYVQVGEEMELLAVGNFYEQFLLNALEFGKGSFVAVQVDLSEGDAELLLYVALVCLLLWLFGSVWTIYSVLIHYVLFCVWQGQLAKFCEWAGTDRLNKN